VIGSQIEAAHHRTEPVGEFVRHTIEQKRDRTQSCRAPAPHPNERPVENLRACC
jgi:hypothetical protein